MNHKINRSHNWGSAFLRTKVSREPFLLQKRTIKDLKYWEWIFIIVSLIGILINLGFNLYQLIKNLIDKEAYLFPIFLIVNNIFAVCFLFMGIMKEQPFQILMQLLTKSLIWVFNLVYFLRPASEDLDETDTLVADIRFYISSSMLFLTIPVGSFVLYQYWTSNVSLFKTVGTEPKYVNMRKLLNLAYSLIAFDVEITALALILVASRGLSASNDLFALIVLPLGLILMGLWALLGATAMGRESRGLTYMFYISSHLQPIYVIYLLVRAARDIGYLLFVSTIVISVVFFVVHISLLVVVVKVQLNYGKGLKQAAAKEMARSKSLAQSLAASAEFLDVGGGGGRRQIETDI